MGGRSILVGSNDLEWPWVTLKGGACGDTIFWQIPIITLQRFELYNDRIWHGNTCGRSLFLKGVRHVPINWELSPSVPKVIWDPLPTPKWFDLERQNLVFWHMWSRSVFLGGKRSPILRGRGPSVPQNFGTPYVRPYRLTQSDQIW